MVDDHITNTPSLTDEEIQLVKDQLEAILVSKNFKSAKQLQRFLSYIVEKTIVGEEASLKQYTIAVEALLFADSFDPDENPAVRIMGGRVRQRLDDYYADADAGSNDDLIISIPKGSYIPEFKKAELVKCNPDQNDKSACCPKLALVSFTDKTQSQKTNGLLLQLTDTLATELSRFLTLQLLVSNPFADKDQSHLPSIEYKSANSADYVLNLFFQKIDSDEDKYRLIYRLLLVDTDEILWSENYVMSGKPIDEQDYIIAKITAKVADHLQGMMHTHWSRSLLRNKDTIPEYSKVLVYFRNYTDDLGMVTFTKSVNACLEAFDRDPYDPVVNVIYAACCRREYAYGYGVIESPLEKGMESIETALRLYPNSPDAHYVHGTLLFCKNDYERCVEAFEVARSISTNSIVIEYGVGFHYCKMDQWEKGLPLVRKAMLLSTNYPSVYNVVKFLDFYRKEKFAEALYEAKKITAPNIMVGPLARCISYAQLGMQDKAEQEYENVLNRYPTFEKTGKMQLTRHLGSKILVEKIWDGVLKMTNKSS